MPVLSRSNNDDNNNNNDNDIVIVIHRTDSIVANVVLFINITGIHSHAALLLLTLSSEAAGRWMNDKL